MRAGIRFLPLLALLLLTTGCSFGEKTSTDTVFMDRFLGTWYAVSSDDQVSVWDNVLFLYDASIDDSLFIEFVDYERTDTPSADRIMFSLPDGSDVWILELVPIQYDGEQVDALRLTRRDETSQLWQTDFVPTSPSD